MFLYTPEQPKRITTWFYDIAASRVPATRGLVGGRSTYDFIMSERLIAEKGADGLYSIRKDVYKGDSNHFKAGNPFSLTNKFLDHVLGENAHTHKFHDAIDLLRAFESEHRAEGNRHRYPGNEAIKSASMVSRLPQIFVNPAPVIGSFPGNHTIL
jgi:hypothetical protein